MVISMRRGLKGSIPKDIVSGSCFLILGLFIVYRSVGFKIWGVMGPQEGFFPFIVGILIIGLSLFIIGKPLLSALPHTPVTGGKSVTGEETAPGSLRKVVYYSISMGCYAILLQPVGFLITTPVFLVFVLRLLERQSWKMSVSVALALTVVSHIVFAYLLMVPLPRGFLK
jgi:putative tricarboxylic transport membrane protein